MARTIIAGISAGWGATPVPRLVTTIGTLVFLRAIMVFPRRLSCPIGNKVQVEDNIPAILPLFVCLYFIFHGSNRIFYVVWTYQFREISFD